MATIVQPSTSGGPARISRSAIPEPRAPNPPQRSRVLVLPVPVWRLRPRVSTRWAPGARRAPPRRALPRSMRSVKGVPDGCRHRLRSCGSRLRPAPRRTRRVGPGRAPRRPARGGWQPRRPVVAAGDARPALGASPRRRVRRHARPLRLRPAVARRLCERWTDALAEHRKPLVLTVHDLRNPHHGEPELHDAQLGVLVSAADGAHHPHAGCRCRDPGAVGTRRPRAAAPPRRRRGDDVPTRGGSTTASSSGCT